MSTNGQSILRGFLICFQNRQVYSLDHGQFWQKNRRLLCISIILFIGVLLWRSWPNFIQPGLFVEDKDYFSHFYGNRCELSSLFRDLNGYITLLTNFIAMMIAKIDVRQQPFFYLFTGTCLAIVSVMILPCSGLLRNKYIIFISPFLLGLSGLNHLFYYITLAYQIYVLVIILLGLLFWQPLKGNLPNILLFVLLSLLIWSGPYSVLTVPFSLCFILFFRGKTWLLFWLSMVSIFYTLTVTEHTIMFGNLFNQYILITWFKTLVGLVFFMDMAGSTGPTKLILTLVFFLGLFGLFRKDYFYLKVACLLFVLINSSLAALFLSKKYLIALRIIPCYLVIAQYLWLFFLLFTVDRFLSRKRKYYHCGIIVCLLVAAFSIHDNAGTPSKRFFPLMESLPEYLNTVYKAEQLNLYEQNRSMVIELGETGFRLKAKLGKVDDPTVPVERIRID